METKHTKGEWKANKINATEWEIISNHQPIQALLQLANVRNGDDFGTIEKQAQEAKANAKLIAAAPDLLKELKRAFIELSAHVSSDETANEADYKILSEIEATIKKATE